MVCTLEAGLGVSAGLTRLEVTSAGCPAAATPAHLRHLSGGDTAPWGHASASLRAALGWKVPLLCVCPTTVRVTPVINSHCVGTSPFPPFHPPSRMGRNYARVTVLASAREGRACPGQQLGGSTVGLGPATYTQSPSPAQCLRVEPQPSLNCPHLQRGPRSCLKRTVTVHGPGTIELGLNRFFFFFSQVNF